MSSKRARILVVDDNLEMARTIADGLADRCYDAVPLASGAEAVERLSSSSDRFDAIVTDL